MNLNATLLIQSIVFVILGLITMRYIWPPLIKAIEERQRKIAEGLASSERAEKSLAEAKASATDIIKEARVQASKIVEQANRRSNELVDEARGTAVAEGQRLLHVDQRPLHARLDDDLGGFLVAHIGGQHHVVIASHN